MSHEHLDTLLSGLLFAASKLSCNIGPIREHLVSACHNTAGFRVCSGDLPQEIVHVMRCHRQVC